MKSDERGQLIDALLDGDISEADFLRLEAELHVSPDARQDYYDRLKLDTVLQIDAELAEGEQEIDEIPRHEIHWSRYAAVAAAIVVIGASALAGWSLGKRPGEVAAQPALEEPAASGFGVLAEDADAVWTSDRSIERGDLIPSGELRLASGMIKFDLFSGVTVIVEGEAEFQVVSPMEMRVTRGKVRALVPEQAEGFRIHTAAGDLVDLGTEFSMEITPEHADLHVLDGEVEWHPKTAETKRLKEGEAIRWGKDGKVSTLALEGRSVADLEKAFAERRDRRREAWRAHVEQQRSDPRLVVYYPMNTLGGWNRMLSDASQPARNATIVRAQRVADRWDSPNSALDFTSAGSRARLDIPGEYGSLTLVCWVKIDSLDRWYNSLFLTDGHELNEPHWQIMNDGRLFFSVKKQEWKSADEPDKHVFYSPAFWDPSMSGKWLQIATVYNVVAEEVTHYLDGEPISSERVPEGYLVERVTIGAASIGNWSEPRHGKDPHFAVRNLNGSIDEFAIYSDALCGEEIAELYQIGKP